MSLRKHRKLAGLSQDALASRVGVSQAAITHQECDRRNNIALETARKIVNELNRLGVQCALDDVFPPNGQQCNRLSQLREKAGLSQQAAAEAAGWDSQSRWSGYETGYRQVDIPTAWIILRVLRAHGVVAEDGGPLRLEDVFPPPDGDDTA